MGAILGRTYPRESGGDVPPYSPADASRECIAPGPQAGRREAGLQQLPSRGLSWDFLGRRNEEHAEDKGPEEDSVQRSGGLSVLNSPGLPWPPLT